ncbi:MAG TPA: hypothetical protein PLV92_24545, partial [Pirellulaceae bacterium]|nr:hypothetical protein [Pirellulaceae bacterium]
MRMQRGWLVKSAVLAAVLIGLPLSSARGGDSSPTADRWFAAGTKFVTSHPLARWASFVVTMTGAAGDHSALAELTSDREWTHRDGRRAKLTFVEVQGEQVVFRRATDDRLYKVALADLSDEDRGLIERRHAPATSLPESHFIAAQQDAAAPAANEMAKPNQDAWRKALETVLRNAAERLGPICATPADAGDEWLTRLVAGLEVSADGKAVTWRIGKLADGHPTDEDQTSLKGLLENDAVQQLSLDT